MGAVLSSIPLCSRQGQDTGDNKPEERQDNQAAVLAQPQSVHQQVSQDLHTKTLKVTTTNPKIAKLPSIP